MLWTQVHLKQKAEDITLALVLVLVLALALALALVLALALALALASRSNIKIPRSGFESVNGGRGKQTV
ncbi:hypothetical protein [Paenibacillus sp. FSL M7-0896]|uniref:hypothetical protein n=1 Tax=Paenibacillus sp. FSL M7-0896 TaxID=2921610 RepID=UPI0030D9B159